MGTLYSKFAVLIATGFGLGYSPKAPGTIGTLGGLLIFWLLRGQPWWLYAALTVLVIALSSVTAQRAGQVFGEVDSGKIVIDEIAGYMVATTLVPFSWLNAWLAFGLFRLFDITKPPPARYFDQRVHNGFGVTMDDVMAGIYACACMHAVRAACRAFDISLFI